MPCACGGVVPDFTTMVLQEVILTGLCSWNEICTTAYDILSSLYQDEVHKIAICKTLVNKKNIW